MLPTRLGSAILFVVLAAAPAAAARDGWDLFHALVQCGRLEVHAPASVPRARLERARRDLEARTDFEVTLLADGDAGAPSRARVVLASWDAPAAKPLLERLGVERLDGGGFELQRRTFVGDDDVLVAWFADPERDGLPVLFYFADEPSALADGITDLMPAAAPSFTVRSGGSIVLSGALSAEGEVDRHSVVDRRSEWAEYNRAVTRETRGALRVFRRADRVSDERAEQLYARVLAAWRGFEEWVPSDGRPPHIDLHVYAHLEDKLRLMRDPSLVTLDPARADVHVVDSVDAPIEAGVVAAWLNERFGTAAHAWVEEALPLAVAGRWWGRELEAWVARLQRAGLVPDVAELIDPSADVRLSAHVRAPLRALLATLAVERGGDGAAESLWTGAVMVDDALVSSFVERVGAIGASHSAGPERAPGPGFLAGVALEPAGPEPLSGYAARAAERSLDDARSAGVDAVALSTFAFLRPDWPSLPDLPLAMRRVATQSDGALAHIVRAARERSMTIVLQPHLLSSPSGTLAGGIAWNEPRDWATFYDGFGRFLAHYALLAELLEVELLCIGTELEAATSFEAEEWRAIVDLDHLAAKRGRWVELTELARRAFDGALTYAPQSSRLGQRVREYTEWQALDFVSAPLFQGLPGGTESSYEERLRAELDALVRIAAGVDRPLLLLSAGFRSTEQAALRPDVRTGEARPAVQLELYEALGGAIRHARGAGALAGVFLWSWSTDPLAGGRLDTGFTPQGKPAARLLSLVFGG